MTEGVPAAPSLADQALDFAQETGLLLSRVLPGHPT